MYSLENTSVQDIHDIEMGPDLYLADRLSRQNHTKNKNEIALPL